MTSPRVQSLSEVIDCLQLDCRSSTRLRGLCSDDPLKTASFFSSLFLSTNWLTNIRRLFILLISVNQLVDMIC